MDKKTPDLSTFLRSKHEEYLLGLDKCDDEMTFIVSEYQRVPGCFWCIGALKIMGTEGDLKKSELLPFVQKCYRPDSGGFGPNIMHDPCATSTHYAILLFSAYDSIFNKEIVDIDAVGKYLAHLQKSDGSFMDGDWGEVDMRFMYYSIACLKILNKLSLINIDKAVEFILRCCNPDGAFGIAPGSESHAAYSFCAVAALKLMGRLNEINVDKLGIWLAKRQTSEGGFNGRPEKLPDVCFSWWVLATLYIIKRDQWCTKEALKNFVLRCQSEDGAISDRQGNVVDAFHTFFGTASLALMGYFGLAKVDPVFAIPVDMLTKMFPHALID